MNWGFELLNTYWPLLLIFLGVGCLIYGFYQDEVAVGVLGVLFYGGLGVMFFYITPAQSWAWLSQFEVVKFLSHGAWYEVALKVTGAIGAVGLVMKIIFGLMRAILSDE